MRSGARAARAATAFASALLLLSVLGSPPVLAVASSTTSTTTTTAPAQGQAATPTSLAISVVPPKLPADGGSYPAVVVSLVGSGGAASLALNDTTVFLTSSQEGVGSVSQELTIDKGEGFAVANFTTSTTPGTTSISASSSGLSAVSAPLVTATPSGFATRLSVIPVPASQLANPTSQGTVLVETLDSNGFPAQASSSISVALTSSNNNVVSLPSASITVAGGSVLSSATYDVGVSPGTATITGSASGFNTGSGTVTVQGASPFALSISAQPDPIATSTSGRLVVTLVDPRGDPAPAPAPITIAITSSNTSVAAAAPTATIATGQVYAVTSFASGGSPGTANLTASSPGLMSDYSVVTVTDPVSPAKLTLIAAPDPVPANQGGYDSIVVALTDSSGAPAVAGSSVTVTLTSSNSAVGGVSGSVGITAGSSYGVARFTSTFFVGSTFITASAQNLQSALATVSSYGPVPTKLVVQATPSRLPADGGEYPALEVMLEDASGMPAVAPESIEVQLSSSSTDIAAVNSSVVIGAGLSYALADVSTTISPGVANITATSSGFPPSETGLTTSSPAPSQLGFYVAPASGIQSLGQGGDAIVAVQLQDSTSSPAGARQYQEIVVTSSNSSVIAKPLQLEISPGEDYAWTYVKTSEPGQTVLTASTNGLASASATLAELSLPVSISLTSSVPVVEIGGAATVQLVVDVMGAPLAGANVTFLTTSGTMGYPGGVTDSSGQFTDTFVASGNPGAASITASVQDPLLGNLTAGTNIIVILPGGAGTSHPASKGLGSLFLILPIVLVIVVIAIVVLGARRIVRGRRDGPDEGEERPPETV